MTREEAKRRFGPTRSWTIAGQQVWSYEKRLPPAGLAPGGAWSLAQRSGVRSSTKRLGGAETPGNGCGRRKKTNTIAFKDVVVHVGTNPACASRIDDPSEAPDPMPPSVVPTLRPAHSPAGRRSDRRPTQPRRRVGEPLDEDGPDDLDARRAHGSAIEGRPGRRRPIGGAVPPEVVLCLYRVTQEGLGNVAGTRRRATRA